MKLLALATAAALAALAPAAASAATQVKLTGYSFAQGSKTGTLHYAGSPFNNGGVGIGAFALTGSYVGSNAPAAFHTYCVDIFHALSVPGIYDLVPLSQMYTGVRATNINKILANTNATNADQSAAVQLALWEVAFETGPTFNVSSGAFYVDGGNSAAARTLANTYLSNLGTWQVSTTQTARLLYSPTRQSQVYLAPVPEASTWAMMIAGMGIAGSAMRRRKRNAVYALA